MDDSGGGTASGNFALKLLGAGCVVHPIDARIPARRLALSPGACTDSLQVPLI